MNTEKIILYSSRFEISESTDDPEVYIGKFIICDFDPNKNDVQLNREKIDNWLSTLVGKPLVGKIKTNIDGSRDFSSHNMKIITKVDDFGNEYRDVEFDTSAFGTFIDASIEEIEGAEYITATTKIWKRFHEACEIIKSRAEDGCLATSWEIATFECHKANYCGKDIKVIDDGCFLGHCLLGADVEAAYSSSKLLDVASKVADEDLEGALINDLYKMAEKEEDILSEKKKKTDTVDTENTEIKEEVSALTERDLRNRIADACREKTGCWCWVSFHFPVEKTVWIENDCRASELDYMMFTYEVSDDEVTVSDPTDVKLTVSVSELNSTIEKLNSDISERDNTIIQLNERAQELSAEISTLTPFKETYEDAERERIQQETSEKKLSLQEKIINSGAMTIEEIEASEESEVATKIKSMIEDLDENGINSFIVEHIISSTSKSSESHIDVSESKTESIKTDITDADELELSAKKTATHRDLIDSFIGKR